jgi:hypothetical protein
VVEWQPLNNTVSVITVTIRREQDVIKRVLNTQEIEGSCYIFKHKKYTSEMELVNELPPQNLENYFENETI